jgi:predicted GIY-YIG superfamily endonuclease
MTARTHFVYRAFDADGRLLYVGCTKAPQRRHAAHRNSSPWFQYAEHFTMAGPYAKAEALRREDAAIESENPWFNATRADRGNFTRWRRIRSREWERLCPYYETYTPGVGWNREAMHELGTKSEAAANAILGPRPNAETRHAAYLAALEASAMTRSAA